MIQSQGAGVGQQPVRVSRQGRNHRHDFATRANMAVDFRGHGGGLGGVAQHGGAEFQHHDFGVGSDLGFLFIGDEGEG